MISCDGDGANGGGGDGGDGANGGGGDGDDDANGGGGRVVEKMRWWWKSG